MGIDGIGKRGGIQMPTSDGAAQSPGVGSAGIGKSEGASKAFELGQRPPTQVGAAAAATGSAALDQVRAGTLSVDQYLDLKVDQAVAGLDGLGSADLGQIKSMLRDQLASDPHFVELVKSATGAVSSSPSDE